MDIYTPLIKIKKRWILLNNVYKALSIKVK